MSISSISGSSSYWAILQQQMTSAQTAQSDTETTASSDIFASSLAGQTGVTGSDINNALSDTEAEEKPKGPPPSGPPPSMAAELGSSAQASSTEGTSETSSTSSLDTDGDGEVSMEELLAAVNSSSEEDVSALDTDDSGDVSADELLAAINSPSEPETGTIETTETDEASSDDVLSKDGRGAGFRNFEDLFSGSFEDSNASSSSVSGSSGVAESFREAMKSYMSFSSYASDQMQSTLMDMVG